MGGRRLGEEKDALLLLCPLPHVLGACNSTFLDFFEQGVTRHVKQEDLELDGELSVTLQLILP